ncbi:uncharacterized protein LOC100834677 [Brachypodium distachyon]|uniref:Uncharacterized protein n=1 Tax=Brachypodium distachyon TaxID=15368 RepID=I1H4Z6_BRADI|nr:uncharacterized protein LOC100834677 [Brachypodium distachyon]KQK21483.1 hypothetical protein BRADI_1g61030v3 [Brachypodium distachyon]|eukprot:XP_003561585.1 uncharacterized protein LOC100834677 [Brachypodium distachyon]
MAEARDTTAGNRVDDQQNGRGVAAAPPTAARGSATISITIVLLALLVASVAAFLVSSPPEGKPRMEMEGAGFGSGRSGAEPVEQAVGHGVPGFNSRLDAFRAWAKLAWMKLQRRRSDEPRYDTGGVAGSAAEASKKSMEMGKETVEQAAATAADAMGMAKDKVKGAAAPSSDAEL